MSSTADTRENRAPVELLQPLFGDRFVLSKWQLAACAWFTVFFMYLNYVPLFHSDIWCHVNYGEWMLQQGRLVSEDPFMPLAAGMRVVNNAWLSQLIFAAAHRVGGPQGMSNVFAVVVLSTFLVYTRIFYLQSGKLGLAIAGMAGVLAFGWTRHAIIRPEIFGALFLATLFWMLMRVSPWRQRCAAWSNEDATSKAFPGWLWFAIPLLFALWANMHGSFAVGLLVIASHCLGIVLHAAWRERDWNRLTSDPEVRRWIWLAELAAVATLLNPYGLDLLIETARFGSNENLRDVLEWFTLDLVSFEGIQFLVGLTATLFIVRFSDERFHAAEVMLMLGLMVLMASTVRMIGWLAPIWVVSMMPHLRRLSMRLEPHLAAWRQPQADDPNRSSNEDDGDEDEPLVRIPTHTYTILAGLVVWCGFALSPISEPILNGKPRPLSQVVSKGTPLGVTEYLREHPPETMVWGPQWWGDWLVYDGPDTLRPFMTTTLHLAPNSVWKDYMRIARSDAGWESALAKYNIRTIVMDKELQPVMHRAVRRSGRWTKVYEDSRGVIYQHSPRRLEPANRQAAKPDAAKSNAGTEESSESASSSSDEREGDDG